MGTLTESRKFQNHALDVAKRTGERMATVQELKDALTTEQERAVQLSEKAFQAIDTVTNAANFWLTTLSIILVILGLIGLTAIYIGARRAAVKVAQGRIDSYLKSTDGKQFVRQAIEEEVRTQIEQKAFIMVHPAAQNGDDSFPVDPKAKAGE